MNYFKIAYENLGEKGVMVMDMMGGKECYASDVTDKRTIIKGKDGFKYHWEQAYFNPVTADCSFFIHFKFGDGSMIKKHSNTTGGSGLSLRFAKCWLKQDSA